MEIAAYIVPVGAAHHECSSSFLQSVVEIAVTDDVVEDGGNGPDVAAPSTVLLQVI